MLTHAATVSCILPVSFLVSRFASCIPILADWLPLTAPIRTRLPVQSIFGFRSLDVDTDTGSDVFFFGIPVRTIFHFHF
ncbi:hypothetical protein K438DRAFT_570165 [Mycena galopus ATCC 62051]|nr:hypothetical protein K438DRAFT_570165 [Mycena galopus ATCC 62051]